MRKIWLTAILVMTFGCGTINRQSVETNQTKPTEKPVENNQTVSAEEYLVMSTVLSEYDQPGKEFIIMDLTIQGHDLLDLSPSNFVAPRVNEELPQLLDETKKDFNERNRQAYPLEKKFSVKSPYTFITKAEYDAIFKDKFEDYAWKDFYKKYPKALALYYFSRVGFSSDKKQAVIQIHEAHGTLGKEYVFFLLAKNEDAWKVEKKFVYLYA